MTTNPFIPNRDAHRVKDRRLPADDVAVRERNSKPPSPHVLDLGSKITVPAKPIQKTSKPVMPPHGIFGRFRHLLDERIHLHDLRMRTLSIRPRGWKDFPPQDSTTMKHAVRVTVSRFFDESPFAELTILSLIHLVALTIWHATQIPKAVRAMRAPSSAKPSVANPVFAHATQATAKKNPAPAVPTSVEIPHATAAVKVAPILAATAAPKKILAAKNRARLTWQPGWQKSLLAFASVALLFIVPMVAYGSIGTLKDRQNGIVAQGVLAMGFLRDATDAAKSQDFVSAEKSFALADASFADTKRQLGVLATLLNEAPTILPGTSISAESSLLNAGSELAVGGEGLSQGIVAMDAAGDPAAKVEAIESYLNGALPHLELASDELGAVSPSALPAQYRDAVTQAQEQLPKLTQAVSKANAVTGALGAILGADGPKRYLLVFQNNAEMRPTGGFMGSFAVVDVEGGKITNMSIPGGGTYDLKGSLGVTVSSPQPLHLINPLWQFQDANWYPDFPTSAKQITWFYDHSGGPTTDGVIAVNATLMEKLLAITGPIDMPEYGKTVTSDNFYDETQTQVELDYDKTQNKPKQFIADLAPKMIDKLSHLDHAGLVTLAATLDDALSTKDVQMWFNDANLQSRIAALGWSGELKNTDGDYVSLIDTNIGGQKTDLVMHEDVQHAVKIMADGTGIVTLTISRTHTGQKGALFSGVRNVDYLRVYVPQGSMLVEAHGFEAPDPKLFKIGDPSVGADPAVGTEEQDSKVDRDSGTMISDENGKTVFGNWVQTDPGQTSVVTLVYQLPSGIIPVTIPPTEKLAAFYDKLTDNDRTRLGYSLLVQKQSGTNPMTFTSSIDLPQGFTPSWQSPQRTQDDRGNWTVTSAVDRDSFFGTVAESP